MSKKLVYSFLLIAVFAISAHAQFISAVAHRNTDTDAPEGPRIAPNPLAENALTFVDRTHVYADIPEFILGAQYVMLANDNKNMSAYELDLTFAANATLYVFVDNRMGGAAGGKDVNPNIDGMGWLTGMGFVDTGEDIGIDENFDGGIDQYLSIYSLSVPPGTITIYGNTEGHTGYMLGVAALGFKSEQIDPDPDVLYSGGSGTADDPYQITTAEDLMLLGDSPEDYDKHFILTADIDLDPNLPGRKVFERAIIAPDTDQTKDWFQGTPFTGVFDGNNYIICNVDVNVPGSDYVGLFGYLTLGGQIKNLGVENITVLGDYDVGGLVGSNFGTISNCYSTGSVSGTGYNVGGLVGSNFGAISNCYSTGSVSGDRNVGGLVGNNSGTMVPSSGSISSGTISDCYSTGSVTGNIRVGGLVGDNYPGTISNCYSTGSVSGDRYVGGLVGNNSYFIDSEGTISNCYSTGSVSGGSSVGGVVGLNSSGTISNCYSTGSVSGTGDDVGGLVGANSSGTISNCYSTGSVSGKGYHYGGLVGYNASGAINNCCSAGSVSGTGSYGGGLVGSNGGIIGDCYSTSSVSGTASSVTGTGSYVGGLVGSNFGTISNCYSTGSVSGTGSYGGGLVGENYSSGTISNCYSAGLVSVTGYRCGGLVGSNSSTISNSFWDVSTSGRTTSEGGTGKTTAEMQTARTFLEAGWDFVGETENGIEDIWFMPENDYPHLTWENMVWFPDYMPLDPNEYGIKTFEWVYGQAGEYTSRIGESETVPYLSGLITGVQIIENNNTLVGTNDGLNVSFLASGEWILSTDPNLTAHPTAWSFAGLYDGMIIDQGVWYLVKRDMSEWDIVDDQQLLIDIQDVTVPQGRHNNAVIFWYLDTAYSFAPLDFHGNEFDLGITLPSSSQTAGYSVTGFDIFAVNTGLLAHGDIDAATGSLNDLAVLKQIE